MPDLVKVTIVVDRETLDRYVYAAERRGTRPAVLVAQVLHDDARGLPPRPRTVERRPYSELRDESRERRGGVSAHTEAHQILRPRNPE